MGVLTGCVPRADVLKGELDDAIFAAEFGDLIAHVAPAVYQDAATFFQNTHPAERLCGIVQAVFGRLADPKEPGAAVRLSTGFGGGKTHALMALWHLAANVGDVSLGTELLPAAGRPKAVRVVAVDAGKAGVPEFTRHDGKVVRSLWGEVFYQLDPTTGLSILGAADDPEASPSEDQISRVLPPCPLLVLLDELVVYMAKLSPRGQGNLLGFVSLLIAVTAKRPQMVLVVTDPGSQAAYATESADMAKAMAGIATKLDDVVSRKATDSDPIGDETAQVITRRLLHTTTSEAAQTASAAYHSLYTRLVTDSGGVVPLDVAKPDYAKRIVKSYPFHPRLLRTTTDRLQSLPAFQRSRGVLRLFARVLRGVWEAQRDVELITAGDIDWTSQGIQSDLLSRLDRLQFRAAIDADVKAHAAELDGGPAGIHRRVASAILLESITLQPTSGLEPDDLALAVLRPDDAGPEPAEAMERLMRACWHTYPTHTGKGCVFRYEPNILKQIEQRRAAVPVEDARRRVEAEAQGYFSGPAFTPHNWPSSAKQVPDSAKLQLALCADEKMAKAVCAYSDDTDPAAPMPRRFVNAILAVTASPAALAAAVDKARWLLAGLEIERESKGDSGKLAREQLNRILPDLRRQFALQSRRAFDVVVLPGGSVKHLDEKYQVDDEQVLASPRGQTVLRRFLDDNALIYQPGDALDPPRFMRDVLAGATPIADQPDVYTAKAVHERFLSAPRLRLIPDGTIVRQTVLKALADGLVVVRLPDDRAFGKGRCVQGPAGHRRLGFDELTTFDLNDTVRVTPATSPAGVDWMREDQPDTVAGGGGGPGDPPPPPPLPPGRVTANTWDKLLEYAADRPLLDLVLTTATPADTTAVQQRLPPLGATALTVTVTVSGTLRDGTGSMSFAATDVKPTHPAKPLLVAQTLFNSVADGSDFEVLYKLAFGPTGRPGMDAALSTLRDAIPDGVGVKGTFDKPAPGGSA
jgi:hypothetical protein